MMGLRSSCLALGTSAALCFSVNGAQAGGDGYAPVSNYNWSSLYVGLHAGGAWSQMDYTFFNGDAITERFDQDPSSFLWGGHIGLQRQWGNWVAGIEVSYSGLDLDDTIEASLQANRSNRVEIEDLLLATLRLGWTWDRSLFYVKGGYASAQVGFDRLNTATGIVLNTSGDREHGWTAGAGWEYALTANVILGLEYNFVRLDIDDRVQTPVNVGTCVANCTATDIDADLHTVMARISFKTSNDIDRAAPLK